MTSLQELEESGRIDYAHWLASTYPDFRYSRALYLDFEGSTSKEDGSPSRERILSLYYPQYAGDSRFAWFFPRAGEDYLSADQKSEIRAFLKGDEITHVVVFSSTGRGTKTASEQERFERCFGTGILGDATWIDLHDCFYRRGPAPAARKAIREGPYGRRDQVDTKTAYCLEALERMFGLRRRPASLRSRKYTPHGDERGEMKVLEFAKAHMAGELGDAEQEILKAYCLADVENMFKICRKCQRKYAGG